MGFHHVGQTGLELLASSDLPASASQSAGIIGENHRARLDFALDVRPRSRPGAVAHACNPSTLEAKAGGLPEVGSSRPA